MIPAESHGSRVLHESLYTAAPLALECEVTIAMSSGVSRDIVRISHKLHEYDSKSLTERSAPEKNVGYRIVQTTPNAYSYSSPRQRRV